MAEIDRTEVFLKEDLQSIGINPKSLNFSNFQNTYKTQTSALSDQYVIDVSKSGQPSPTSPPPVKYTGYIFKSRKWPMKGWHKRFFVLENGMLTYAKTPMDIDRGKWHGQMDVGMSVIACKSRGQRIDLDADYLIYHLKMKSAREYEDWTTALRQHRLYRLATMSTHNSFAPHDGIENNNLDEMLDTEDSPILDLNGELRKIQLLLFDLNNILNQMQTSSMTTSSATSSTVSTTLKKEKSNGKFHLGKTGRKEKKSKDCLMIPEEANVLTKSTSIPNLHAETDSLTATSSNTNLCQEKFYLSSKIMYEKRKKYRLRLCVDTAALRSWIVH